jgi:hypothetical protein
MAHQASPAERHARWGGWRRLARVSEVMLFLMFVTILGLAIILVPQGLP